jgi:hypothetical protein
MTPDGPKDGETKNIGVGGALISCEYTLPLHERICVIFKVPNRAAIAVNTMVARLDVSREAEEKEGTHTDVALYYIELTDEELEFFYAIISKSK